MTFYDEFGALLMGVATVCIHEKMNMNILSSRDAVEKKRHAVEKLLNCIKTSYHIFEVLMLGMAYIERNILWLLLGSYCGLSNILLLCVNFVVP